MPLLVLCKNLRVNNPRASPKRAPKKICNAKSFGKRRCNKAKLATALAPLHEMRRLHRRRANRGVRLYPARAQKSAIQLPGILRVMDGSVFTAPNRYARASPSAADEPDPLSRTRQGHKKAHSSINCALFSGDLAGNRTRDCAVRGRRLNRLTTRPYLVFGGRVAPQPRLLGDYSI